MIERIDDRLSVGLTAGTEAEPAAVRVDDDAPFCVLIAGEFGGTRAGTASRVAPIPVDRDEIDAAMARIAPALDVVLDDASGDAMRIEFRGLDDFHPDRLYERMPVFRAMAELRESLSSPRRGTAAGGAGGSGADGHRRGPTQPAEGGAATGPVSAESLLSMGSLLDSIVAATGGSPTGSGESGSAPASDPLDAFLRGAVESHLVREPDAGDRAARDRLDLAITAALRALLHHPGYQRLEARWRAIDFLARRLETGPNLKLFLADLPGPPTSGAGAAALDEVIASGPTGTAAGTPWAVVVLDWEVAPDIAHADALERIAAAARRAGTVLLAGADPRLATFGEPGSGSMQTGGAGDDRPARARERWSAFRRSPAARHVGLVMPRFLIREPYGRACDPCDAFPLEEMESDPPPHESYLWANGAFAAALVVARAFEDAGWRLEPALRPEIDGLPLHAIDDGTDLKPCAEVVMDERTARALLDAGLMPLASVKHADRVHLVRVQSVAEPVGALAGAWARDGG